MSVLRLRLVGRKRKRYFGVIRCTTMRLLSQNVLEFIILLRTAFGQLVLLWKWLVLRFLLIHYWLPILPQLVVLLKWSQLCCRARCCFFVFCRISLNFEILVNTLEPLLLENWLLIRLQGGTAWGGEAGALVLSYTLDLIAPITDALILFIEYRLVRCLLFLLVIATTWHSARHAAGHEASRKISSRVLLPSTHSGEHAQDQRRPPHFAGRIVLRNLSALPLACCHLIRDSWTCTLVNRSTNLIRPFLFLLWRSLLLGILWRINNFIFILSLRGRMALQVGYEQVLNVAFRLDKMPFLIVFIFLRLQWKQILIQIIVSLSNLIVSFLRLLFRGNGNFIFVEMRPVFIERDRIVVFIVTLLGIYMVHRGVLLEWILTLNFRLVAVLLWALAQTLVLNL